MMDNFIVRSKKDYIFKKVKLCSDYVLQPQLVELTNCMTGQIIIGLEGYLYEMTKDIKIVTYTFQRPTFLDWLLHKKRTVKIKIRCKELLKNTTPIKTDNAIVYNYEFLNR